MRGLYQNTVLLFPIPAEVMCSFQDGKNHHSAALKYSNYAVRRMFQRATDDSSGGLRKAKGGVIALTGVTEAIAGHAAYSAEARSLAQRGIACLTGTTEALKIITVDLTDISIPARGGIVNPSGGATAKQGNASYSTGGYGRLAGVTISLEDIHGRVLGTHERIAFPA